MDKSVQCEVLKEAEGVPDIMFKLIIIGEPSVGKSCLLVRAVKDEYKDTYEVTVGAESSIFLVKINQKTVQLQVWDTAGMEKFRSMVKVFFTGSQGAFIVYDITRKETFEALDVWLSTLRETTTPDVKVVLVGNKKDEESQRQVTSDMGKAYVEKHGLYSFVETSAKTGEGVIETFINIAKSLFLEHENVTTPPKKSSKTLEEGSKKGGKKGCC